MMSLLARIVSIVWESLYPHVECHAVCPGLTNIFGTMPMAGDCSSARCGAFTGLPHATHERCLYDNVKLVCHTGLGLTFKPYLAGACFGAGMDMITAADIRYCTADATFCVKEVDLAIVADMGTLQRLPRIVGEGQCTSKNN